MLNLIKHFKKTTNFKQTKHLNLTRFNSFSTFKTSHPLSPSKLPCKPYTFNFKKLNTPINFTQTRNYCNTDIDIDSLLYQTWDNLSVYDANYQAFSDGQNLTITLRNLDTGTNVSKSNLTHTKEEMQELFNRIILGTNIKNTNFFANPYAYGCYDYEVLANKDGIYWYITYYLPFAQDNKVLIHATCGNSFSKIWDAIPENSKKQFTTTDIY